MYVWSLSRFRSLPKARDFRTEPNSHIMICQSGKRGKKNRCLKILLLSFQTRYLVAATQRCVTQSRYFYLQLRSRMLLDRDCISSRRRQFWALGPANPRTLKSSTVYSSFDMCSLCSFTAYIDGSANALSSHLMRPVTNNISRSRNYDC